jgi:predicted amidohydrolase
MKTTAAQHRRGRVLWVAAAQMKFASDIAGNLALIERAVSAAVRQRADAVLFPECATTGYGYDFRQFNTSEARAIRSQLGALASRRRINLLVGSPDIVRGELRNCLLVFDRAGRLIHRYAKCQLTPSDREVFAPGNAVSLFKLDGIICTAIICHERRYPELVRLAVMAGAQIVFHPNAGMDRLAVSRAKHGGRDGIAVRAFENAVFYIFANSVGPQGGGLWSAGDSKIVGADGRILKLAGNHRAAVIVAELDPDQASRKYALEGMQHPRFLAAHWRRLVAEVRGRARARAGHS